MMLINVGEIRKEIDVIGEDKDCLMAYWNHSHECAHLFDTEDQIWSARRTYDNGNFSYQFTKEIGGYNVVVFQREDRGKHPEVDPLALGLGFVVEGLAMLVKRVCWHCHTSVGISHCSECKIALYCDECRKKHKCYVK